MLAAPVFILAVLAIANSVHASATVIKASKDTAILYGIGSTRPQGDCKQSVPSDIPHLLSLAWLMALHFTRILIGFE